MAEKSSSEKRQKKKPLAIDKAYIDSGSWKCEDSPTGAHHWVQNVDPDSGLSLDDMPFVCKHCRGVKFMKSFYSYSSWYGDNNNKKDRDRSKHGTSHKPSKFTRNPKSKYGIDNG